MKKGAPVKFRACILALVLPLGMANFAGCDFLDMKTDAEHIAKAKELNAEGDVKASIRELQKALRKNPNNAEARALLGQIDVSAGAGAAAEKELRRALELGAAREAIVMLLAEALQIQGKNSELVQELVPWAALDVPKQARLFAYRGEAWLFLSKPDRARQEYEEALRVDPKSALATLGMGRLALLKFDFEKALELTNAALELDPQEARAWSLKGEIQAAKQDFAKAEESFGKAIENRLNNQEDLAQRALARIALNNLDGAWQDIDALKKKGSAQAKYPEGLLLFQQGRYTEAAAALEKVIGINPEHLPSRYYLGISYLMQGNLEQAESHMSKLLAAAPNSLWGHRAMALIKFRYGDYNAAKESLTQVVEVQPNDVFSLKMLASIEFSLGNKGKGLEYAKRVTELDPKSAAAEIQLGWEYLAAGRLDEGVKAMEKAAELDPQQVLSEVYVVAAHLRAKEFEKAAAAIAGLEEKMPDEALPLSLRGTLHLAQGDDEKAKAAFLDALKKDRGELTAGTNLALMAAKSNRPGEARKYYEQILAMHPGHAETMQALAELDMSQGRTAETEARLSKIIHLYPYAQKPRLILARFYLQSGQAQRGEELLAPVRAVNPRDPELLATLTDLYLALNNPAEAIKAAKTYAEAVPTSAVAQFYLATAYSAGGNRQGMRSALEQALKLDPKFLPARIAMVGHLLDERNLREAGQMLGALQKEFPTHPEVLALRGAYALRQKQPEEAVQAYRQALEKLPNTATVLALAQAQWAAGQKDQALDTLEQWSEAHPEDRTVYLYRAGYYKHLGKRRDAIAQYRKLLELKSDDALVLNELAWLLMEENPSEALGYAEKAVSLAPRFAPALDTLALVLIEMGQDNRALSMAIRAHEAAPEASDIFYHLAMAQEHNGQSREALGTLKQLLLQHREFAERAEAEELLKKLTVSQQWR
jgi:putative PEP-CTERM system TPR-repeat lipoprotein